MADQLDDHRCAWRTEAEQLRIRVSELEGKASESEAKAAAGVDELNRKAVAGMAAM